MKIKDGKRLKKWAKEKAAPTIKKGAVEAGKGLKKAGRVTKKVAVGTARGVEKGVKWYRKQRRGYRRGIRRIKRTATFQEGKRTAEWIEKRAPIPTRREPKWAIMPDFGKKSTGVGVQPNINAIMPSFPKKKASKWGSGFNPDMYLPDVARRKKKRRR